MKNKLLLKIRNLFWRRKIPNELNDEFEKEIARYKKELEIISDGLLGAAHIDDVFWQVQAIIANNPEINHNDVFQEWIAYTYVDSITIRLRRLIDRTHGTVSLMRLLESMKRFSICFSRERHINLHEPDFRDLAEHWFDDIAGKNRTHVTKARIEEKKNELLSSFSRIESYVNTQIAHSSQSQSVEQVTFEDVRNVIVAFFNVYNWCLRLISQAVLSTPVPQPQSNWLKYFRIPWIKPGTEIPHYRHLKELIADSQNTDL